MTTNSISNGAQGASHAQNKQTNTPHSGGSGRSASTQRAGAASQGASAMRSAQRGAGSTMSASIVSQQQSTNAKSARNSQGSGKPSGSTGNVPSGVSAGMAHQSQVGIDRASASKGVSSGGSNGSAASAGAMTDAGRAGTSKIASANGASQNGVAAIDLAARKSAGQADTLVSDWNKISGAERSSALSSFGLGDAKTQFSSLGPKNKADASDQVGNRDAEVEENLNRVVQRAVEHANNAREYAQGFIDRGFRMEQMANQVIRTGTQALQEGDAAKVEEAMRAIGPATNQLGQFVGAIQTGADAVRQRLHNALQEASDAMDTRGATEGTRNQMRELEDQIRGTIARVNEREVDATRVRIETLREDLGDLLGNLQVRQADLEEQARLFQIYGIPPGNGAAGIS